jgi:hypothetical protein
MGKYLRISSYRHTLTLLYRENGHYTIFKMIPGLIMVLFSQVIALEKDVREETGKDSLHRTE